MSTKESVLITRCSYGGIGHVLAQAFQKRGLQIFAAARSLSKISDLEGLPNFILLSLDVTSASDIAAAVEAVKAKSPGGKLDYLVNNSGRQYYMRALDADIDEAKKMFEVSFRGVLAMIQASEPPLFKAQSTSAPSRAISTLHGRAAVNVFGETLRLELAPLGINVVTVITGSVASNIMVNGPKAQLPPCSRYASVEKTLIELGEGKDGISGMSCHNDVLNGATGLIWRAITPQLCRMLRR